MPKPVVLFLRFGKNAKYGGKKIPPAFVKVPCWVHHIRDAERHSKVLELPDPPVAAKDEKAMFAVIEGFCDEMELATEVCTDEEMEDDELEYQFRYGFRVVGTIAETRAAFEADGFRVITVIDPKAVPPIKQSKDELNQAGLEALAQDLDLASLDLVRTCLKEGRDLPHHAASACQQIGAALKRDAAWIKAHVDEATPSAETRVLLKLLVENRPELAELLKSEL